MGSCPAFEVPERDQTWNFCPNIGAAYVFMILFALTTCAHIAQAFAYRKAYCWVIIMSAFLQFLCYMLRILSIKHPASKGYYSAWFILILVSPLWTNAFVYMVMGRMVFNFTQRARLFGIKAWRLSLYFVLLDILAFIVQVGGASIASGADKRKHTVLFGLHMYMGGVGLQQLFILSFFYITYQFRQQVQRENPTGLSQAFVLLYAQSTVLVLITIRIIFRMIEYAQCLDSSIPNHEIWQYIFDSVPMLITLAIFNSVHPGRIMPGKESDFPSRKARKTFFRANHTPGNSMSSLPVAQPVGPASMPE